MEVIRVKNLTRTFRQAIKEPGIKGAIKHLFQGKYVDKIAVNNISFTINKGEAVAYLGKNGAGKSTTIKMLTGILRPTSGELLVNGIQPHKNRLQYTKEIGVVFGQRSQLWMDIPIYESFKLLKDIYGISNTVFQKKLSDFSEMLDLNDFIHLPARKISLGQRMKADLVASLLHNPKILYLDEPTIGLDIESKNKIRKFISYLKDSYNTTILLTTHDLADIEQICDRLILIDEGRILYDGTIKLAKEKYANLKKLHVTIEKDDPKLLIGLSKINSLTIESKMKNKISITFNQHEVTSGEIITQFIKYTQIYDISIEEPSIENILELMYLQ
ncbi:ATP-binding cassette domain-containing protein [Bacillales bacterium AN1005]